MAQHTTTVAWRPKTEPGALDGWDITCAVCGDAGGSSLQGMAIRQADEHTAYWGRRQAAEAAA